MTSTALLRLRGVVKKFGNFTALHGVDLDIEEGEFFTIVGPSGSGKSTIIRLLVGMDEVTDGEIWLRGERIDQTPANQRPTCMVFQSLALFPHMSVGQNIEFPLKLRKEAPAKRRERAHELLDLLRLPRDYYDKRISQCSGGEQQRVALARALAFDPEILFFDEPLSALDYRLRKTLEKELKDLHARTGKTFVYITHSLEEAMVMSDRIAIMKDGRFEQIAVADEIYSAPVSRFVAEFMGEVNLFDVTAEKGGRLAGDGLNVRRGAKHAGIAEGDKGVLMVRPEYVQFAGRNAKFDYTLKGTLIAEYALGSRIQYEIEGTDGQSITVEKLREDRFDGKDGVEITLGFNAESAHLIGRIVERTDRKMGLLCSLPMAVILFVAFLAPMVVVFLFSIMPQKVFSLANTPDFSAYTVFFAQGYYKSLLWSLGMALASTAILLVISWPLAYGMAKVFGRFTLVLTIAVVMSLFVSENIRLFGWVLTLMKGGLFEGHFRAWTGVGYDSPLYTTGIIIFGLVYVYLPFMLFPLAQGIAMVPDDTRQAAADLGATKWQVLTQIEIPLAAPGIVVGSLLSFVLAAGALAESKILGGQTVIAIADDIETAFTFGQDWPLGSALSMILIVIIGGLALFGVSRVDLDAIMGRKD